MTEHPDDRTSAEASADTPREATRADLSWREFASQRLIVVIEDAVYVLVAIVLVLLVGAILWDGVSVFLDAVGEDDVRRGALDLLDNVLLVLMLVELLHTVSISIRENALVPRPFLVVGLIAAVRRILILTAEQGTPTEATAGAFRLAMLELVILGVLIVGLVWGLIALSRWGAGSREEPGDVRLDRVP